MASTGTGSLSAALPALDRLKAARSHEPHPLRARPSEVAGYVRDLQRAEADLDDVIKSSNGAPKSELGALKLKAASANAAIERQALLAARRIGRDRAGTMEALNSMFKLGSAPAAPLNGRYRGSLLSLTMNPPLDAAGNFLARLWLPWMGKRFIAATSTGDNVFTPSAPKVGRLFWPFYSDYKPYRRGLSTAFLFNTYLGPGVEDPELEVLKLDYDNDANPSFLIRTVLDELVQVSGDYYLGKAFLKVRKGYKLAAFFALRSY
jgi:hypothetical protein